MESSVNFPESYAVKRIQLGDLEALDKNEWQKVIKEVKLLKTLTQSRCRQRQFFVLTSYE